MLAELEQRFAFLVSRQRDLPPRHRTLRAVIESSYQLLSPELQQFFTHLAVFRGGWTQAAPRGGCGGPPPPCYSGAVTGRSLGPVAEGRGRGGGVPPREQPRA